MSKAMFRAQLSLEQLERRDAPAASLVTDLNPFFRGAVEGQPESSGPTRLIAAGDRVFFTASTRTLGTELWVSDGTSDGTHLVKDLDEGAGSSAARIAFTTTFNGNL